MRLLAVDLTAFAEATLLDNSEKRGKAMDFYIQYVGERPPASPFERDLFRGHRTCVQCALSADSSLDVDRIACCPVSLLLTLLTPLSRRAVGLAQMRRGSGQGDAHPRRRARAAGEGPGHHAARLLAGACVRRLRASRMLESRPAVDCGCAWLLRTLWVACVSFACMHLT